MAAVTADRSVAHSRANWLNCFRCDEAQATESLREPTLFLVQTAENVACVLQMAKRNRKTSDQFARSALHVLQFVDGHPPHEPVPRLRTLLFSSILKTAGRGINRVTWPEEHSGHARAASRSSIEHLLVN